ncbi:MAG TPA: hypothetical protein VGW11_08070 [Solirubrobacteraceae bacterium]|nr:hypothetical protein [Solirubrobacteraceae bacterium]
MARTLWPLETKVRPVRRSLPTTVARTLALVLRPLALRRFAR